MTGLREAREAALARIDALAAGGDLDAADAEEAAARAHARFDALEAIEADYPPWQCWVGIIPGVVYARRPRSTPPRVVRAPTAAQLRDVVAAAERDER